jgi:3-hydroxyacyl-[acyl-carrier-protein] dehydratase
MRLEYFQLIDRIASLDLPGRKIVSEAIVPTENTIFEGHFPGFPLMPGVLLIETMAQTAGWLVVANNRFERMAFLASVKEAKFRTFVTPGQTLTVSADLKHEGSGYAMTETAITCEGRDICNATIAFRVMSFPSADLARYMHETARRVGLDVPEAATHA